MTRAMPISLAQDSQRMLKHQTLIASLQAALAEQDERHAMEVAALKSEIAELKAQLAALNAKIDKLG